MTRRVTVDALMSVRDLAEYIGVPIGTLYNWSSAGIGPRRYRLNGGRVRYRVTDVDKWLEQHALDTG